MHELAQSPEASDALAEMAADMRELSAAVTRGELKLVFGVSNIFRTYSFDSYWRLYTIFQESNYRDAHL